ncbi:MAG: tRNA (cytidine(34)-2'-O)-methyltransferase [Pseudomonadota bacterium]|nr:tRNA (cytidine(34)-2'-O)-methyltransferase [Pseudomonadota bacterium]
MLHVVLYEPEIPPNTGNVIRLCANTGATLHLVEPLGFKLDDKGLRRSGLDYHDLADVRVHADLDRCLDALARASGPPRVFAVETGGRLRYSDLDYRSGDAFVFGPETRGLPAPVLDRIGQENTLFIPMKPNSRSINLSNAVAIVVFDAWRHLAFAGSA